MQRNVRAWRAKLFTKRARPTPILFRWVRKLPVTTHLAIRSGSGIAMGPHACFDVLRQYWKAVMESDVDGHREALVWAQARDESSSSLTHSPEVLLSVAKMVDKSSAPGLDCWPAEALRFLDLAACRTLIWIFRMVEEGGWWPLRGVW